MVVTDDGIVNEPVKPLQPEKAVSPMEVTDDGIVNEPVKPLQPKKANCPMEVTDDGIVKLPVLVVGHCISIVWFLLNNTPSVPE